MTATSTRRATLLAASLVALGMPLRYASAAEVPRSRRFDFGPGAAADDRTVVEPGTLFTAEQGFGFEPGPALRAVVGGAGSPRGDCITGDSPFLFSVAVGEGNYDVTVVLGGDAVPRTATVRAESRRLMLERVQAAARARETRTFAVNVRTPSVSPGDGSPARSAVALGEEERAFLDWDDKLTLEFSAGTSVCSVEVARNETSATVFLAGDSTVSDQPREPFASWGQMLTRFLGPGVAIANHAHSGESMKSFIASRRLAKVLSQVRRGDYLFVQFGHNDQKPSAPQTYVDERTYEAYLGVFVAEARQRGAVPVLVTPVQRRQFDEQGRIRNSHRGYPGAVRELARREQVALVDLEAMSRAFYEALGPARAPLAFASGGRDATHHDDYGAYELAKCVVRGIRAAKLDLARFITDDFGDYDPARPDPVAAFALPRSAAAAGSGTELPSLFVAGDSTAAPGHDGLEGWAVALAAYLDPARVRLVNRARSGRSSRTYLTEGHWGELLASVRPGDLVLIQFGHNDASPVNDDRRARGTLAGLGEETEEIENRLTGRHEVVHTFGWYVRRFVVEVRGQGGIPILLSPTVRNEWSAGRVERGPGRYREWTAELAHTLGVGFVDVSEIVARRYEALGPDSVGPLFPRDHTHTSPAGAELNARAVVAGLKGLPADPAAAYLSKLADAVEPWRP